MKMKMKTPILLLSILDITHPFPLRSPLRATSSTLRYRTSEYGESDGRVLRYGGGDDRVSVLNLLEAQSVSGGRSQHSEDGPTSISKPQIASTAPITNTQTSTHNIWSDVDGDRSSLASLLEPPAPPLTVVNGSIQVPKPSKLTSSSRITNSRSTPIIALNSLEDYTYHVISNSKNNNNNQLTLIRFSAPWCQVCRTTNVAFERMASKLCKGGDIQFCSVSLDSNQELDPKNVLKDHLQVHAVPTGVLYHPSRGIIGRVNLNRVNLGELKKRLGGYVSGALHRQGEMMWMEALVMGLEVGEKKKTKTDSQ
ncbi:hypothetical protein ACHAWX_000600, partial [Stephanocyclus meneghinianus]